MYVIVNTFFRKYKIILNIIFRDKQNFNEKNTRAEKQLLVIEEQFFFLKKKIEEQFLTYIKAI